MYGSTTLPLFIHHGEGLNAFTTATAKMTPSKKMCFSDFTLEFSFI